MHSDHHHRGTGSRPGLPAVPVLSGLGGLVLLLSLAACSATIPAPTGQYLVGSTVLAFNDESRTDHLDPQKGSRRFLARVWYPARSVEGCKLVQVVTANQADALTKFMNYPRFMSAEGSTAQTWADAPAITGQKWPVLFFEHGGFSMETQNFLFLEDLASHGYVVFALNHPHESLVSEFPDGRLVWASAGLGGQNGGGQAGGDASQTMRTGGDSLAQVVKSNNTASTAAERWKALTDLGTIPPYSQSRAGLEVRIGDLEYLRRSIDSLNAGSALHDTMDTGRVGLIGHSMGGYTVGEALLRHPDAYALAVNLDGPQIVWAAERNLRFARPILFMYSTDLNFGGRPINTDGLNRVWAESSAAPAWEAVIKGMGHFNYSDLGYLSSLKYSGLVGPIDGVRGGFLYTAVVRAFVDKYLKDEKATFLDQMPADWKEVTLRVWNQPGLASGLTRTGG